jgi:hypothetical protein
MKAAAVYNLDSPPQYSTPLTLVAITIFVHHISE